jgi:predicted ATPase/DNA-binding CsgD family transcriptional regulator
LQVARQLLLQSDARLITLTGPPGVGKTRLAIELANAIVDEFEDGACFVDLAPLSSPQQVLDAIASALGLRDFDRRSGVEILEEYLRELTLLLVVDNFEHVLDAAELIGHVLATCANVKVIATSRAPLHLQWERELAVSPLPGSDASKLFLERAQTVAPEFVLSEADASAVDEICSRLDGLPLAIELAAARIKLFPPRALARRLARVEQHAQEDSAWLLLSSQHRDLPERHQALLRAISWSYDLLASEEQTLLRRLSVFVGGCTVEAAEAVGGCGLDLIAGLVDKSLLGRDEQPDGEPRLRMLETIQTFAAQQPGAEAESEQTRSRHAGYYVELVERAAPLLFGPQQQTWFGRFERERPNLLAVEAWATMHDDAVTTLRLGAALWPFWLARDDASHTRDRVQAIIGLVGRVTPSPTLVHALHGAGLMAEKHGEYATCRSLLEQAVVLARQLEDPSALATVLDSLGRQKFIEGRYLEARSLLEESHALLRALNDPIALARLLSHLGFLEFLEGRTDVARGIFQRGLAVAQAAGDQHRVAEFMDNLGNASEVEGDFDTAAHAFEEAIAIWRQLGQGHWLAMALNNLGKVEIRQGELDSARAHLWEALSLAQRIGNRRRMAYALAAVSALAAALGEAERAAMLQAVASATFAEIGAALPLRSQLLPETHSSAAASLDASMTLERAVDEELKRLGGAVPSRDAAKRPRSRKGQAGTQPGGLTRRERDVAVLVAAGHTNRQIAEELVLTEGTAENYVQRILGKLGFNNRAQIAAWAVQHDISAL